MPSQLWVGYYKVSSREKLRLMINYVLSNIYNFLAAVVSIAICSLGKKNSSKTKKSKELVYGHIIFRSCLLQIQFWTSGVEAVNIHLKMSSSKYFSGQ